MPETERARPNCPFYGHHLFAQRGQVLLFASHGNQCALVTDSFHPCDPEVEGKPVDWRECPRARMIQRDLGAAPVGAPHA